MTNDDTSASSADNSTKASDQVAETPQQSQTPQQDANQLSAGTSSAGDKGASQNEHQSLLDIVKDVVNEKGPEQASKATPDLASEGKEVSSNPDSVKNGTVQDTELDDSNLPFHKHPRFQQVIQERSYYKREAEAARQDADEWRSVRTYMDTNHLTNDEVARGFEIMSAMKNDPLRGREMLKQYWEGLQEFAGHILPQDLQQRVNEGEVTDEVAVELARKRNEAEFLRGQQLMQAQRQAQEFATQQHAMSANIMRGAVTQWESEIKTRDADYSVKQPFLMDKVRAMIATSPPRSAQEALGIVESAYRDVNSSLKQFTPQRQPSHVVRSEMSSAVSNAQPKSLKEAVRLAAMGKI